MLQATAVQGLRQLSAGLLLFTLVEAAVVLLVELLEQAVLEAAAQGKITTLLELLVVEILEAVEAVAGIHRLVA
jgi:hypothetical protein